jgi:hypothetical protein
LDIAHFVGVMWIWGLTSDFWAENGKEKIMAKINAIE